VRLRQVMSVLETLYSGETILVIFPDGTGPALLSALIAGIPLNRVHELEYAPGELRMDITQISTLNILKEKETNQKASYEEALAAGRKELERLRSTKEEIVSLKDQKIEAERIEIDNNYNKMEAERLEREDQVRENRLERQRQTAEAAGKNGDDGVITPLAAVGAATVVGTAGIFAASGNDLKEMAASSAGTDPLSDSTTGKESADGIVDLETDNLLRDEFQSKPTATLSPPAPPVDPYEAAEKAMEEYLDRDDGAGDWLTVMADLYNEDDASTSSDDKATEKDSSEKPFQ